MQVQPSPDRVDNIKHADINSLLKLLAEQLEISVDMSSDDFALISDYCLDNLNKPIDIASYHAELIKALQYFDRFNQCAEHVISSLRQLANELSTQEVNSLNIDFTDEIRKIYSIFNEEQAGKICQHLHLSSIEEQQLLESHWKSVKLSKSGHVDFF